MQIIALSPAAGSDKMLFSATDVVGFQSGHVRLRMHASPAQHSPGVSGDSIREDTAVERARKKMRQRSSEAQESRIGSPIFLSVQQVRDAHIRKENVEMHMTGAKDDQLGAEEASGLDTSVSHSLSQPAAEHMENAHMFDRQGVCRKDSPVQMSFVRGSSQGLDIVGEDQTAIEELGKMWSHVPLPSPSSRVTIGGARDVAPGASAPIQ